MNKKLKLWELERVSEETFKNQKKFPVTVILNDIRSLNNIGSFFRTADAFNVEKIYLCGITANPPHRDIQKTALGATETVIWEYQKDIIAVIENLKKENVSVFAIEQVENSIFLQDFKVDKTKKYALVFGNEVYGVAQKVIELCDGTIEIPQLGTKHSLNISVSAGIVIWDLFQKMTY